MKKIAVTKIYPTTKEMSNRTGINLEFIPITK